MGFINLIFVVCKFYTYVDKLRVLAGFVIL